MLLVLLACTGSETLIAADPAREGAPGELGPWGAVLEPRSAQARVEERVPYDWIVPGSREPDGLVLFVHGGLVDRERYRWAGAHFATHGYAVAAPAHDLDLAIFDAGNARYVLDDVQRREGDLETVAMGHSLGGVIASWSWQDDSRVDGVALLASFPAGEGPVVGDGDVLSISGTTDAAALPDDVRAGAERYADARLYFVEGMNHYAWTDDPTPSELEGDGPLERPPSEVREDALRVLDTWLGAVLRGDAGARARLDGPFPGVIR